MTEYQRPKDELSQYEIRMTITFALSLVALTIGFIIRWNAWTLAVSNHTLNDVKYQFYVELGWAICLVGALLLSVSIFKWIGEDRPTE